MALIVDRHDLAGIELFGTDQRKFDTIKTLCWKEVKLMEVNVGRKNTKIIQLTQKQP